MKDLNFPAVDALIQPSSLLHMAIVQLDNVDSAEVARAEMQLRGSPKRLYFVVPPALFHTYRMVLGVGTQAEQWVLKMPWVKSIE